ncbi:MAG: TIGR03435 family protein, partial [Burkholderiales bacterium]
QTYELDAVRITMAELASELRSRLDRPVVDATGLTGVYEMKMPLPVSPAILRVMRQTLTTNVRGEPIDFGAVVDIDVPKEVQKLGLKLVERKAPIDVVVIDNINRAPTEN